MTTSLYVNTDTYLDDWTEITATFTPSTTGTYYLGFHAFTPTDEGNVIMLDAVSVSGPPADNDAAITAITSPVTGQNLTATEPVTATILNNGVNTITSVNLELTVDGSVVATEIYTGSIASDATVNYTFTATANLSAAGNHTVTVKAILTGDTNAANDSKTITVRNSICSTITAYPFTEDFEGYTGTTYSTAGFPPDCWFTYAQSGSAVYTPHVTGSGDYSYPHSGTNALTFTSGDGYGGDNTYAVLPNFDKSLNQLKISFWYKHESASYGTLTVGYVTGSQSNISSYVPLFTVPATSTLTQVEYALVDAGVDLSAATNIAFRWYKTSTYYSVGIDDINVDAVELTDKDVAVTAIIAPVGGLNLTATEPVTVTIQNKGTDAITSLALELTVNDAVVATETYTGNIASFATTNYTFTATADLSAAGNHTITVKAILAGDEVPANNALTVTVNNAICNTITAFPFTEGFESGSLPDCWSVIDANNNGYTWDIRPSENNPVYPEYDAHNGSYYAYSPSWISSGGIDANDYLITPQLAIPANGTTTLEFYVGEAWNENADETYSVMVSTTGKQASDFSAVLTETLTTNQWVKKTVSLNSYSGQNIYIAFRHFNSYDIEMLKIDDVSVTNDGTNVINLSNSDIKVYPNPVTDNIVIENAAGSSAKIYDISGKVIFDSNITDATQTINIGNISAGVYFLELQNQATKSTVKLIKK